MKAGRNDPCPCGSGKKYKACCQRNVPPAAGSMSSVEMDSPALLSLFHAGHFSPLENHLNRLTRLNPHSAFLWSLLGATLQMQGKDGLMALQKAISFSPDDSEAHSNLGTALHNSGRFDEAETSYRRAIEIRSDNVRAILNLGNLLLARNRPEQAESFFRQALHTEPRLVEAFVGLGNALAQVHRSAEAEDSFRSALQLFPDSAEAYFCLGNLQRARGVLNAAESSYSSVLKLSPGFAPAYNNLGSVQLELGRHADAVASFQQALGLDPNYCEAHGNLGLAFVEMGRFAEAEASCRRALKIRPNSPDLHGKLGSLLKETGRAEEAEESYRQQIALDPGSAEARIALALLKLPIAPLDAEEAGRVSGNFSSALDALSSWLVSDSSHVLAFSAVIGVQQPFHLAYRDGNHVELLSRYGDMVSQCVRSEPLPEKAAGGKIRLVVVSNQIRRHSVWDIVLRGLLINLDRSRFEVILYHTGTHEDEQTGFARSMVDVWRDRRQYPHFDRLFEAVKADRPDVILYPEIGMDPFSFRLAAHRLASLQIASWGHPITTGLPTIDLYLSGQLLESDNAEAHYRERLVRLPGTGCCTTPLDIAPEPIDEIENLLRQKRGIRFVIAQRAFKFDPAHDVVYADIAASMGESTFIVLQDPVYPWATRTVLTRLQQAFRSRGLDPEQHLTEIPWLTSGQFVSLLDSSDIFLDCPGFSGYTTAWQALHRGLPVVTLEGDYMRQRLAAGLLRKTGRPDLIAHSAEEYAAIAVRLAAECGDPVLRHALRETVKAAAERADGDLDVVRAFEHVVITELAQHGSSFLADRLL